MEKFRIWIQSMRLRTLPLSLAGIVLGTGIAAAEGYFDMKIFLLAVLTAVSYQILSNLANDYGDGIRGTDKHRTGPKRAVASGLITPEEMKIALVVNVLISVFLTFFLLITVFPHTGKMFYVYFILGLLSIWAALKYTIGKHAFGYKAMGDLFVLIFFGWVAVEGVYFLFTKRFDWMVFLAATSIGLLSVAVLNINNMRDLETDRKSGKKTLAVKLGYLSAIKYQRALVILALLLMIYFTLERFYSPWQWAGFIFFIPLLGHIRHLNREKPASFNVALKKVSVLTFLFSLFYSIFMNF